MSHAPQFRILRLVALAASLLAAATVLIGLPSNSSAAVHRSVQQLVHETVPANYPVAGIDIASYQHPNGASINWTAVAATKKFVYIKATESTTYTNAYYAGDVSGALGAGMYVGAYAFAQPQVNNPAAQADYLLSVTNYTSSVGGRVLVPFLDLESTPSSAFNSCYNLNVAQMSAWISTFVSEFQARAGRAPMIYTSDGWWNNCMAGVKSLGTVPLDTAKWSSTPLPLPGSWSGSTYTFWQYGSADTVSGITGAVDGDVFNGSMADLAAFAAARPGAQTRSLVGDVTGDGKSDLITLTGDSEFVAVSSGSVFGAPTRWSKLAFYGTIATYAADVNGDGKADLVAVNSSSVWVMLSTGTAFGPPMQWSTTPFYGARNTLVSDLNGDGKADLVAVNGYSTWAMLSTGSGFSAPKLWSSATFYGARSTLTADVNGDGKADLVAVNGYSTWVLLGSATGFGPPVPWSSTNFYGDLTNLSVDVNGDHKADLVAYNHGSIWVMPSTGSAFGPPKPWSGIAFYGTLANLASDVTGDGSADVIAVNTDSVWVLTAGATTYGSPHRWW